MCQIVLSANHSLLEILDNATMMQHGLDHECFWQKFVKLLQGQNHILPYLKFLNDAQGRNEIKVGFNYSSLWKRLLKIAWKDNMSQTILPFCHALFFENWVNAEL